MNQTDARAALRSGAIAAKKVKAVYVEREALKVAGLESLAGKQTARIVAVSPEKLIAATDDAAPAKPPKKG